MKHFTYVSRHFGVYCREQKKIRENCLENLVSDVKKNGLAVRGRFLRPLFPNSFP